MTTASGHLNFIIVFGILTSDSFYCKYGCCGTTEKRRCCSEQEGSTWEKMAVIIICVVVAIIIQVTTQALKDLLNWLLKKQNKKTIQIYIRVRDTDNRSLAPTSIPAAPNGTKTFDMSHLCCKPPPYSPPRYTELPNGDAAPTNIPASPNGTETFDMSHLYCKPPPYSPPRYTELPNGSASQSGSRWGFSNLS